MIHVTIQNERGRLDMGSYDAPLWRIIDFDGLGIPSPERTVQSYAGQIGQTCTGETVSRRTITIAGELMQKNAMYRIRTQTQRILNQNVNIMIDTGHKRRCINGRCTSFDMDKPNMLLQTWVMQFVCDDPRFRSMTEKNISVYQRVKLIDSVAKTPCMFSRRTNKASIINDGDYPCEPVFRIYSPIEYSGEVRIYNHTTGQSVAFVHDWAAGETVTVNIADRRIDSDMQGNIINTITDDTFLSDFVFDMGINDIEVISTNVRLSVVCRYHNYYAEAVL